MTDRQYLERKASWRDDHLKSVCAFANADGGVLEIGREDDGALVGIATRERRRLLDELPNKVRDLLGIVASVRARKKDGVSYVRIAVEPHPFAISYRGVHYRRHGSTNHVLGAPASDRSRLDGTGERWEETPDPRVALEDLDPAAMTDFRRRATTARRLPDSVFDDDDARLVHKLRLTNGDHLTNAAILLFHHDPEQFLAEAHIKIGYFPDDWDVRFHDVVSGGLFKQLDEAMEVLLFKYLRAGIGHEGTRSVESYPVPEPALREAILNAVVHRDYAIPVPIQIRVHDDRVSIYNPGSLPDGWTPERLLRPHPSHPYNPDIANAFYRVGEIDAWGCGIGRILQGCERAGVPEPKINLEAGGVWLEFRFSEDYLESVGLKRAGDERDGQEPEPGVRRRSPDRAMGTGGPSGTKAERILALLRRDPSLTHAGMAKLLGTTPYSVRHHLDKLRDVGRVRRIGSRRTGRWEVVE